MQPTAFVRLAARLISDERGPRQYADPQCCAALLSEALSISLTDATAIVGNLLGESYWFSDAGLLAGFLEGQVSRMRERSIQQSIKRLAQMRSDTNDQIARCRTDSEALARSIESLNEHWKVLGATLEETLDWVNTLSRQ